MTNDLEQQLRSALRPVDPDEGFAERVLARVARETAARNAGDSPATIATMSAARRRQWRGGRFPWFPAALAASLVLGVFGVQSWQQQERTNGLEARRQLLDALRVTSEKLDLAYEAVNSPTRNEPTGASGA